MLNFQWLSNKSVPKEIYRKYNDGSNTKNEATWANDSEEKAKQAPGTSVQSSTVDNLFVDGPLVAASFIEPFVLVFVFLKANLQLKLLNSFHFFISVLLFLGRTPLNV